MDIWFLAISTDNYICVHAHAHESMWADVDAGSFLDGMHLALEELVPLCAQNEKAGQEHTWP